MLPQQATVMPEQAVTGWSRPPTVNRDGFLLIKTMLGLVFAFAMRKTVLFSPKQKWISPLCNVNIGEPLGVFHALSLGHTSCS